MKFEEKAFFFREEFLQAAEFLNSEQQAEFFKALCRYVFDPDFSDYEFKDPIVEGYFILAQPLIKIIDDKEGK